VHTSQVKNMLALPKIWIMVPNARNGERIFRDFDHNGECRGRAAMAAWRLAKFKIMINNIVELSTNIIIYE